MKVFSYKNEGLYSTALLVLRIAIGSIMFAHGATKVLGIWGGKGLEATATGMSTSMNIPLWLAYLSPFTEFLGGIFILLGLFTRFFSIAVLINMLVAVFAVHLKNGFIGQGGFEYPALLAMVALAIAISGPGIFSLDHALFGGTREVRVPSPRTTGNIKTTRFTTPAIR
jgi:putative oxidoreductase